MSSYNQQIIRELLSAAFSAGEIQTLAFDLFQPVYQDFTAGMPKSQMIRAIVEYAEKYGKTPEMLDYIQDKNSYQFNRFAAKIRNPEPDPQPGANKPPDFNTVRLNTIYKNIKREQELLDMYEEQRRTETNPRRLMGIDNDIKRQKDAIEKFIQEAAELGVVIPQKDEAPQVVTSVEKPKPQAIEESDEDKALVYEAKEQPWFPAVFPALDEFKPEQMGRFREQVDVVIMVATEVELRAALNRLEPYPRRKNILRAFVGAETYYLGKFGAYRTAVTRCGMGSGGERGSTLATPEAIRTWQPKAIIMPGIAFGKDPAKQKMADVLVASQIIPYDHQRVGEQTIFRAAIPPSNATLLNRFENALDWRFERPDGRPSNLRVGPILSGGKLVDNLEFKMSLFKEKPEAVGGEMEGAGLAGAAGRNRVPWILVKGICDWGDGKKHDNHQPLAAAAAVSLVHHILSQRNSLHGL